VGKQFRLGGPSSALVVLVLLTAFLAVPGHGLGSSATEASSNGAGDRVYSASLPHAAGPGNWTILATNNAPSTRYGAVMVYDPVDNVVLLFGGSAASPSGGVILVGDTWVFQNGIWVNLTATLAVSPSPRSEAGFAYDSVDGYVVLFGGVGGSGGDVALNDTWTFHNLRWSELVTPTAPSPRISPAMAWDPADGYVVLFGGGSFQNGSSYANDTWSFQGGVWTQVSTLGTVPTARDASAITYDGADGYVVLFGGWNGVDRFNDTWTYLGGIWTELRPAVSPSPRLMGNGDIVYDPILRETILFGGKYLGNFYNETWSFVAGSWTNLTASLTLSPISRHNAGFVYLPTDGMLLLFGGETFWPQTLNDTWLFGDLSRASELVEVGLRLVSSSCSAFSFGDVFATRGIVVAAARTTYGITALPCEELFERWVLTGELTLASGQPTSASALVAVSGPGTITAQFVVNRSTATPPSVSSNSGLADLVLGFGLGALAGGLASQLVFGPGRRLLPNARHPPERPR